MAVVSKEKIQNQLSQSNEMTYYELLYNNLCVKVIQKSWESSIKLPTQLKCPVILLIGNNEERVISNKFNNSFSLFKAYAVSNGFKDVFQEKYLTMRLKTFYLNHYHRNHKDNCINLFGHTHRGAGLYKPYGLNVGCDLNHFQLFSEDEIFRLLQEKENYCDNDLL